VNKQTKKKLISTVNIYRSSIILAVMVVMAAILSPSFLSVNNLFNVIRQVTVAGIVAAGMTFVILTGGIDLSVGSIVGFSGVVGAGILASTGNVVLSILAALGVGTLCGAIMGCSLRSSRFLLS